FHRVPSSSFGRFACGSRSLRPCSTSSTKKAVGPGVVLTNVTANSPQLPPLHINGDEVRKRENPSVLPKRNFHTAFGRIRDVVRHSMLKNDVGGSGIAGGGHGSVVIAPQEPAVLIEPESLDAAVDGEVGSVVGLDDAVNEFGPFDITSQQLVGQRVVA